MNKNDSKPPFSFWFVLASVMMGFFAVSFTNLLKSYSATISWDFGTSGDYTHNSALIEFVGGVARLIQLDQTDNDNNATTGFAAGTHSNTQWDAGNNWLELDATGLSSGAGNFTSRILDAGTSTAQWVTSTITHQRPYGKELPNNFATETAYLAGNVEMHNNMLLFHMNETGANALEAGTITDSSGAGNNGTLNTGSDGLTKSSSTAQFNTALQFDGSNDYVNVIDSPSLVLSSAFTLEAWVYPLQAGGSASDSGDFIIGKTQTFGANGIEMEWGWTNTVKVGVQWYGSAFTGEYSNTYPIARQWNHLAAIYNGTTVSYYLNGIYDGGYTPTNPPPNTNLDLRIGTISGRAAGYSFNGAIDELAIYNRVLSATEVLDRYKRGVNKLKYQVRTCDDGACSGETFVGPNGTATDYYDEGDSNVTTTPAFLLTNLTANRYFQYKAFFETASSTLSPELKAVTSTPAHYNGSDATIVNSATAPAYSEIATFTETLGSNNAGTIRYQLSPDNVYWHYWNNTAWVSSTLGFDHANTSTAINANILRFNTDVGAGSLYYKGFFRSVSSTQQVELDNISITTDPTIYFTSSSFSGTEADGTISISINLSQALLANATVNYTVSTTATSTAIGSGTDYTLANGTATITAGQTTTTFNIVLNNDTLDEDTETIVIDLSSPTNSILGTTTTLTYTFTDNDDPPTIAFTALTASGLESVTPVNIEVLLSATSSKNITVDYVLSGTAAGSGTDYTLANGTATITAGSVTTTIVATIVNDTLDEVDETVILTISNPTNATLGANTTHTYTITDNDDPPTIQFNVATGSGSEATTPVTIQIDISATSSKNITVDYALTGTATGSGTDYTLANGTATVSAGNTTTSVSLVIVDDSADDDDETVIITLSNSVNSSLGINTTHTYTITDNDATPAAETPAPTQGGAGFSGGAQSAPPTATPTTDPNAPETILPTLQVTINNNQTSTVSASVYLALNGGNAKRMAISNTPDFVNIGQENYTQIKAWNLCFGLSECKEGSYTVYVKFYSEFGIASSVLSDTIMYNFALPVLAPVPAVKKPSPYEGEKTRVGASAEEGVLSEGEKTRVGASAEEGVLSEGEKEGVTQLKQETIIEQIRETKPELVKELEETPLPLVLKKVEWDLVPFEPIKELLSMPFGGELANLTDKFPSLGETFVKTGIKTMSDLSKLENVKLTLPNLTEIAKSFINGSIQTIGLPKAKKLSRLSSKEKENIPADIVFAQSGQNTIDLDVKLSIDETSKKPIQTISAVSGKQLQLIVKPEHKVEKIRGFLVVKKIKKETSLLRSFLLSLVDTVQAKEEEKVEYVLLEFEYLDLDGDGIYTADIQTPVVEGEYEIITVMDYTDASLGNKELRLVTVVDPEGYVYRKDGEDEARIKNVTISIFYLNAKTKKYELWPAKEYNQENPQITDKTGKYSFLVPEGTYYLQAEAENYKKYSSDLFIVRADSSGIHTNIEMKKKYWWVGAFDWKFAVIIVLFIFILVILYNNKKCQTGFLRKIDEKINNNKI